jgi:hypothetical protein
LMSTTPSTAALSLPLMTRRVRAYFAPVNRVLQQPTLFDPAISGAFSLSAPPALWIDLGWIENFVRQAGSKIIPLTGGAPATPLYQVRESTEASVSFRFKVWSKLSMALAAGAQHMNVLAAPGTGAAIGSGGKAIPAVLVGAGSTATALVVSGTSIGAGAIVSVDLDYLGQLGFVGTGVSAAYVKSASAVGSDVDYVRRVSFNVARVAGVSGGVLQLAQGLPAGIPAGGMKLQQVQGFVDREGGSFFQEWSALFVMQGEQGDRVLFHYPRLQPMISARESGAMLAEPLESVGLAAEFRALPVIDGNDSEQVLCYRTYLPGATTLV